jgi:hypothetical protein
VTPQTQLASSVLNWVLILPIQVVVAAVRKCHMEIPADASSLYEVCDKESLTAGTRLIPHSNTMRYDYCYRCPESSATYDLSTYMTMALLGSN